MNNFEEQEFLVEIDGKKFIDVVKILPETLPSGKRILWKEVDDSKVLIFVDKHSAKGGNPSPVKIEKLIPISEDLILLLGLWFGDGIKMQGGIFNAFGLANSELTLHEKFLELVEKAFGIDRKEFDARLSVPEMMQQKIQETKNKISQRLKIPLENFCRDQVSKTRNFIHLDLKINSRIIGFLVHTITEIIKPIILKNRNFAAKFISGVIASDGSVFLRDGVRLENIFIAAKERHERKFLRDCLLLLDIIPNKDKEGKDGGIPIQGLSNFKRIKELGLMEIHPKKLEVFERGLKGFKSEQSRKGEGRFKVLQELAEGPKCRHELAKILNKSPETIRIDDLLVLEQQGFVKRSDIKNRCRIWEITEKGLEILSKESPLEVLKHRTRI
ncbi:MAG: transcriptional regulator [Candidatus Aenigmarchaeota archaeon]|nr:transcriptional regulator [Candidatus Aenigmarchaeota archaeon]